MKLTAHVPSNKAVVSGTNENTATFGSVVFRSTCHSVPCASPTTLLTAVVINDGSIVRSVPDRPVGTLTVIPLQYTFGAAVGRSRPKRSTTDPYSSSSIVLTRNGLGTVPRAGLSRFVSAVGSMAVTPVLPQGPPGARSPPDGCCGS